MNTKEYIHKLRNELAQHNYNYYVLDNPTISDYEFDIKLKELQELEAKHPEFYDLTSPTLRVGGEVTKNFETVVHENRMYSLDNSYSNTRYPKIFQQYRPLLAMTVAHLTGQL